MGQAVEHVDKIAAYWTPGIAGSIAQVKGGGGRTGERRGEAAKTGEDRTSKPKTTLAEAESGAKEKTKQQQEAAKKKRDEEAEKRRSAALQALAEGASSSGSQAALTGGTAGPPGTRPYVRNPPPASQDPNQQIMTVNPEDQTLAQTRAKAAQPPKITLTPAKTPQPPPPPGKR